MAERESLLFERQRHREALAAARQETAQGGDETIRRRVDTGVLQRWPVWRAKAAWMPGDRLCSTGWPMMA